MDVQTIITSEDLMLQNLELMGCDFQAQRKNFGVSIGSGCFTQDNAKGLFYILYFLLEKLSDEQEMKLFLGVYPPRATNDVIQFKQVCMQILQKLQKRGRIPRNFVVGKSILDTYKGERLVSFLRFLSQFALRWCFVRQFPNENFKIFNLNTVVGQTDYQLYDINQQYSLNSLNPTISLAKSVGRNDLQQTIKACESHIFMEQQRFEKIGYQYAKFVESIKPKAEWFNQENKKERKLFLELEEKIKELEEQIPRKILGQMRSLDRIQKIDQIRRVYQDVNSVHKMINEKKLTRKIENSVQGDQENSMDFNLIDRKFLEGAKKNQKTPSVIVLSRSYNKFNQELKNCDQFIDNMKIDETIVLKQSLNSKIQGIIEELKQRSEELKMIRGKY